MRSRCVMRLSISLRISPSTFFSPGKPLGQGPIFPEEAQQEMLAFDITASVVAGFVARKEDHTSSLFCVTLKHCVGPKMAALHHES